MLNIFRLPCRSLTVVACSLFVFMSGPLQVQASSPDAWEEYQQEVEQACRNAANASFTVKTVLVDPYGSESFGYALLIGNERGVATETLVVCAYDVTSQKAEISGAFAL